MLKRVRLKLETTRIATEASLFDDRAQASAQGENPENTPERTEFLTEARYLDDGTRVTISYDEGIGTGLEGSRVAISYLKSEPQLVSMTRTGSVKTAMIFESGRRHTCVYQTPIMPFEVCVLTKKVCNGIENEGVLLLDYLVELHGAQAEHTCIRLSLLPDAQKPHTTA